MERAESGALHFVTLEDGPGRPDAALSLAAAGAATRRIGLVATGVTDREPAALALRLATWGRISGGRAGWRPRAAVTEADHLRFRAITGTPRATG
ncbi:LLM class flavin-dependent oxidoreductase [Streptomyces sp. M19]